jgi:dTDP-4-amino-4,6-dideoxygalactose transaminase
MYKALIPFNKSHTTGVELEYMTQVFDSDHLSGDGQFTLRCHSWLESNVHVQKALLTHSCTAALEMAAILVDTRPGDEIIMPSYTFVSTANAFVLRGGIPVFVDIRPDTLNINETLIEAAITSKTKAIVPVHYAGVACEMDVIMDLANRYGLYVIEDAAQALGSRYKERALGSIGHLGCYSFHETKNIQCGEGGALLLNDEEFVSRAEIVREKGTNRSQFFRGQIDKYSWVDVGSSYLPSELSAAYLLAQLESASDITASRLSIWDNYYHLLTQNSDENTQLRPVIPSDVEHNAHMYYLLLSSERKRAELVNKFKKKGVFAVPHYVPLHSSVAGIKFGRVEGGMQVTDGISSRLLRLPFWVGLTLSQQEEISEVIHG